MAEQAKLFIYNKKTDELHVAVSHDKPLMEEVKEKMETTYDKFYSLYAFDEVNYHRAIRKYLDDHFMADAQLIPLTIRKQIREDYYIRDEYGEKMPKGDEKHIFRIVTLDRLYKKLYEMYSYSFEVIQRASTETVEIEIDGKIVKEIDIQYKVDNIGGVLFYHGERTAEIEGFQNKSIKERIQAIIMLMRELKKCNRTKTCVDKVKERFGV